MTIQQLIDSEILRRGENAMHNPLALPIGTFAIGIANKDYPASTHLLWNSVYEAIGMSERNVRFYADPANIEEIVAALREDPSYIGGDVGVGFKDKIPSLLDEVDGLAAVAQSVNVIVKRNDRLIGYNTDGVGYALSLIQAFKDQGEVVRQRFPLGGKRIALLGAGGTTSAIAVALASLGAELRILNRTKEKAWGLAGRINAHFQRTAAAFGADRLVIADVVGESHAVVVAIDDPDSPLYKYSALGKIVLPATEENISDNLHDARYVMRRMKGNQIVSDVMLRDEDTATIREAKEAGFPTLDGRPMVLNQGIEAFWLVNQPQLLARSIAKEQVVVAMVAASSS